MLCKIWLRRTFKRQISLTLSRKNRVKTTLRTKKTNRFSQSDKTTSSEALKLYYSPSHFCYRTLKTNFHLLLTRTFHVLEDIISTPQLNPIFCPFLSLDSSLTMFWLNRVFLNNPTLIEKILWEQSQPCWELTWMAAIQARCKVHLIKSNSWKPLSRFN